MSDQTPGSRPDRGLGLRAVSRAIEHWLAFCTGRPGRDGWQPSVRYRRVAAALMIATGVAMLRAVETERGLVAAAAFGLFWFGFLWVILRGGLSRTTDFHVDHPYLDAAFSIPLAAMFVLVLLPKDWPAAVLIVIGSAYVALIFSGALRSDRRRRASRATRPTATGDRNVS